MRKIFILIIFAISSLFLYGCSTEENVTVTLYLEGNQLGNSLQLNIGDKIMVPCTNKVGYTIDGWYTSSDNGETFDDKWIFEVDEVEEDLSLYARWIPNE